MNSKNDVVIIEPSAENEDWMKNSARKKRNDVSPKDYLINATERILQKMRATSKDK